jgi:transketolase
MDLSPLIEKFTSFGLNAVEINGHSFEELGNVLNVSHEGKALAIVAHTIKGKGVSFMENSAEWVHGVITLKRYNKAMSELNELYDGK